MTGKRRFTAVFVFFLFFFLCSYFSAAFWPVKQELLVGELLDLSQSLPSFFRSRVKLELKGGSFSVRKGSLAFQAGMPGQVKARLWLEGILPLRTLVLDVQPACQVFPGGQSVGVLLHAQGVIVAGFADVLEGEHYLNPAAAAGLKKGDVILSVDGQSLQSTRSLKEAVERAGREGKEVTLKVKRGKKELMVKVRPAFCQRTRSYRLGLLVQEATAGVGTLTFYEPKTRLYGALGHAVDLGGIAARPMELAEGKIVEAYIQEVRKGKKGQPGEKIGVLAPLSGFQGSIERNTPFGIFGRLENFPSHPFYRHPIPVASSSQVHPGKAELLTVVEDGRLERYQVEIIRLNPFGGSSGKDLVVKITDPRLLNATGGIVQGMSGSPLIQDGRLVGAITHVLVSHPERGYAILAERMLKECGLLPASASFWGKKFLSGWEDKFSPRRIIWKEA
ncbi:stage IV sporulation protein B [Ammonifex degensii KC4]|uniref:Stage IV sporulation protein B n=1 Tax=Ammonifex degensii (strain DSM 10501 / KC4) TaxID=429009 RepID=C9R866_AMMDK|nr:SpoIVB peptidase [Ammonifex degensii]ACX52495.1 stage IV sporulation protein B [Ammonifex degensii KC4]